METMGTTVKEGRTYYMDAQGNEVTEEEYFRLYPRSSEEPAPDRKQEE